MYIRQPRHLVQLLFLVITLTLGIQFYVYVRQAFLGGPITLSRPPGVEGFLPIGALMGWKHFFLTGQWDPIHPAAMVILGYAMLLSLLLRKAFCSWLCPVGSLSELCWRAGQRILGKTLKLPLFIDLPLRALKYVLLGFFVWAISTMGVARIADFMHSPYYKLADVKMLFFFTRMTSLTAWVLVGLVFFSVLIKNFWCRYLCPYGALAGLFAILSPTRIRRHEPLCNRCGRCSKTCPSHLPVAEKTALHSPECTGCLDCVAACPEKGALTLSTRGVKEGFWSLPRLGWVVVLGFFLSLYAATLSGHWRSGVSDAEFIQRLKTIDAPQNRHPGLDD